MDAEDWALYGFLFLLLFGGGIGAFFSDWADRRERRLRVKQEEERRKQKEERRRLEGPKPECGCGHHHAYHDPKSGTCQQTVKTAVEWDEEEVVTRWEARTCPCARYSGPEPMTEMYLPEVTGTIAELPVEKKEEEK